MFGFINIGNNDFVVEQGFSYCQIIQVYVVCINDQQLMFLYDIFDLFDSVVSCYVGVGVGVVQFGWQVFQWEQIFVVWYYYIVVEVIVYGDIQ